MAQQAGFSQTPGQLFFFFLAVVGLLEPAVYSYPILKFVFPRHTALKCFLPCLNLTAVNVAFEECIHGLSVVTQNNFAIVKTCRLYFSQLLCDSYCNTFNTTETDDDGSFDEFQWCVLLAAKKIRSIPNAGIGVQITPWLPVLSNIWNIWGEKEKIARLFTHSHVLFCCFLNLAQPKPVFRFICFFALVVASCFSPASAWWNVWACVH